MELELGAEHSRIGPGTFVYIKPGTPHAHRNTGSTVLRFLTFNCRWEDQKPPQPCRVQQGERGV